VSSRYFVPVEISVVEEKLHDRAESLEREIKRVEDIKKAFNAQFVSNPGKPETFYYEGVESIQSVLMDTLLQKPEEIISFASTESLEIGFDAQFLQKYWDKRVKLGIPSRGIMPKTDKAVQFFTEDKNKKEIRQIKFIDGNIFSFKNEIDVYGNNISITSLSKGNEHAVIIRSKSLAQSMRTIFETLWQFV
jgi:hypothetical protein